MGAVRQGGLCKSGAMMVPLQRRRRVGCLAQMPAPGKKKPTLAGGLLLSLEALLLAERVTHFQVVRAAVYVEVVRVVRRA